MCNVNYSILLLRISFYIYIYIYIYAWPGVFHATEKDSNVAWACVFESVTVVFIPLLRLSFLHVS